MAEETRKLVFLVGFIAASIVRFYFARRALRNKQVVDERTTSPEKVWLFVALFGIIALPLLYVFTSWFDFANYNLPDWTGWLGAIIFAAAILLFWRSHQDLGRNWSALLEVRHNHTLVQSGIYRYIRHPMYAAFWLWGIAQALLLHNWICGLSYLVSFLPVYLFRVPQEEQMMIDTFGEQYRQYMKRTGRILPKISL